MFLSFTVIDELGQIRDFSWWFASLEFALDVMSSLSVKGKKIIRAELIDHEHLTQLPIDGFDGTSMSEPIKQLENEWQQLLKAPANPRTTPAESNTVSTDDVYRPPFDERAWAMSTVKFED